MTSTTSPTAPAEAAGSTDPAAASGTALVVDGLRAALAATGTLVVAVEPGQWEAPTGCPEWTVRELVNHLVAGNVSFAALLAGQPRPERDADHLGADPVEAYRRAADRLLAAFASPGVFERVYQAPPGPMPGLALAHLRVTEALVHGWDLAQATAQPTGVLPDALAGIELGLVAAQLAGVPRSGHPFGPAQPVADDAPAIERLVAYLGRSVPIDPAVPGGVPSTYHVVQFQTSYRSLEDAMRSVPELIAEHVAHSARMHERGELLMAGAFLDEPGQDLQTMAVTTTRQAAEAYVAGDPFVAAGKIVEQRIRCWANIFAAQPR